MCGTGDGAGGRVDAAEAEPSTTHPLADGSGATEAADGDAGTAAAVTKLSGRGGGGARTATIARMASNPHTLPTTAATVLLRGSFRRPGVTTVSVDGRGSERSALNAGSS